ncbi:Ankyrin repeat-containing domain protein [Purpureocillium lavendulum]|uniref:Ankyrin repeat-containing domain protein n=1 Tax=Purpureocillium lavendulum TaxID=1247861 RepID=A0AB34FKK9_9HYPO|nr:Ankyrin repeat-containing domain protein [Purpureocillium lavendulum]
MSDPNNYTIGWICALHVEYIAAQEFLDEEHEAPHFVAPNDTNDYTLGAIGQHNIVIAAKIVDMKPATVQCDIETHVHQYLENDENLMTIDADVKADIKISVLNGALGSFRWVQLSLEHMSIQRTKSSLYQALQALPGNLQDIYEAILDKISLADRKLAVVFEESYTSIDDYNLLISSRIIPRISNGLIELDNDQANLAHSSIKEFLTSDWIRGSKVRYFALDPGAAHKNVMRKCVSYLCCLIKDRPLLERLINQLFHTERLHQKGNFGFWVQILIPDADPEDIATTQPLYYAASFGLVPVVKAILGSLTNLEIDSPGGRYGSTHLFVACWRRQYEVVKLLLEAGANTNVVDPSSGHTIFSFAMEYDDHLEDLLTEYASHNSLTETSYPTIGPVYINLVEVALAKESTVTAWRTIRVSRQVHAQHRFRLVETCGCRGEPPVEESRVIDINIRRATLIPIYADPVDKEGKTPPLEIVLEDKASSYRFLFMDLSSIFLFQQAFMDFKVAESFME